MKKFNIILILFLFSCKEKQIYNSFDTSVRQGSIININKKRLLNLMRNDRRLILLDLRSMQERKIHPTLKNAIQLFEKDLYKKKPLNLKGKTIVLFCNLGHRSIRAAKFLSEKGFTVYNLSGGLHKFYKKNISAGKNNSHKKDNDEEDMGCKLGQKKVKNIKLLY